MRIVNIIENIKKKTNRQTYHIENIVVASILVLTAIITNKWFIERIGVIAVYLTFNHVVIANRLQEAEEHRYNNQEPIRVQCYPKLEKYFYAKEICRCIYFILLGAWSALVGVIIFLAYGPRRKFRRKHHPLQQ